MIIVMGMAGAIAGDFIVRVPSLSDATFRLLADTTAFAKFTYWGERLLLRMADREWYRMKRCGGEKTFPVRLQSYDFSGQFGSLEGFSENRN
jgi:hypothetical protein